MELARHIPVLVDPVCRILLTEQARLIVDATVGTGGHARSLLEKGGKEVRIVGIDRDQKALSAAAERLAPFSDRVELICGNFRDLAKLLGSRRCDCILADLGISSLQISDAGRGFSYQTDGPLDMAMGGDGHSVMNLIATADEHEIARIVKRYGEERRYRTVARAIVRARKKHTVTRSSQLREIVEKAVPSKGRIASLSRVFQAFRVWANEELDSLGEFLPQAVENVTVGGRIAVISYHSLEDRIVKQFLREEEKGCTCPPDFPQCVCGRTPRLKILTRRPGRPTEEEIRENPRARSARLRAAERI
jgi:16S rRNA (cytosine1402-N4)-methyltransferase